MNKIFTKEVKIAITAVVAMVAVFFGLNYLKGISLFSNDKSYTMVFSDTKGLSRSTPIYADGYKVGTVSDIIYDYEKAGNIKVLVDLDPDLRVPKGSQAKIESDLMGNIKVVLLLANNPREKIEEGGLIQGVEDNGVLGQVGDMVPAVEAMLPKLDSIVSSLNALLSDPAIYNMLHNVEAMSANLKTSTAELNAMMQGVNKTLPGVMAHANNTMANAEVLTSNLAKVDVASTMSKVNQTLDNVEQLTTSLTDKKGTLGLLMNDPSVYNNLNATMSHADSLMIDLKAHPKRYVHFSIFGKKDN